ncbi:beta-eliminating lyase-related protein [Burkholderia lata]|uniref:beta-eliminating lyase-related protein n=1 Tax=Burkholderia lata (strain ATCC 17760 / DSM 23089 / LMG 22485 / NCIMB 9086 / R18194 / 383) TaxID=482957 RepID=UPI00399964A3
MRKILGGSMRQAGMLAAAGLYALQHHVHRLADDHANAAMLSRGLAETAEANARLRGRFTAHSAQTNILFTDIDPDIASDLLAYLETHDIKVKSGVYRGEKRPSVALVLLPRADNGVDLAETLTRWPASSSQSISVFRSIASTTFVDYGHSFPHPKVGDIGCLSPAHRRSAGDRLDVDRSIHQCADPLGRP